MCIKMFAKILGKKLGKRRKSGLPSSLKAKFLFIWTGKYDGDNLQSDLPNNATIRYGNLYNGYALSDSRNICASGWHLPENSDFNTLITAVGGASGNAPKLKATGTTYWLTGNNGTNEVGLDLRGGGQRSTIGYFELRSTCKIWSNTLTDYGGVIGIRRTAFELNYGDDDIYLGIAAVPYTQGLTVILVKDSTTLSDGEEGYYLGNDNRLYKTICIGTQEWLAEPLTETKYRNGDSIPLVLDQTNWNALDSGGYSYYNGMITNSYISANPDTLIVTGKDWSTSYIPATTTATFAIPNDSKYIQADHVYDNFWVTIAQVINQKTHADLIASETERTFVKYADDTPYHIYAIGILKSGTTLTEAEKILITKYFDLWVQYWSPVMLSVGHLKTNRTLIED